MRTLATAALALTLTTAAARASSIIASYDYGLFGAGSSVGVTSATISFGVSQDGDLDPGDSTSIQLLNLNVPLTGTVNSTYTIDSSDPNWNAALALLDDGNNKTLSPFLTTITTVPFFTPGEAKVVGEFPGLTFITTPLPNVFSSPAQLLATPITSIQLHITDFSFATDPSGLVTEADINDISVDFLTDASTPPVPTVPTPAAFPAGALLLTAIAASTLHLRKRRLA